MANPFKRSDPYGRRKRITPEGEPLESTGRSRSIVRIIVPIIVGIIIISVIAVSSVRIVDAGHRGVLFQFSQQFRTAVEAKVEAQQRALQAQNDLRRIQIEAQQNEAQAIGEQKANIARAEGIKQSNVLQAEGEAQAITIIDQQLRNNPTYLEWLKATKWDGVLPLVTGGGAEGGQGVTPFIEIPTSRSSVEDETQTGGNATTGSPGNGTTGSSAVPSSILNRLNSATTQQ